MNKEQLQKAKELFVEALGMPSLEQDRFIEERCRHGPALGRHVESLLDHHREKATGQKAVPTAPLAAATGDPVHHESDRDPSVVGSYRIIRRLGSGGMGVVYKAIQNYPRRTVALKVIRPDLVSQSVLNRFRFETEVLAKLQHPAIAQLYEAGVENIDGQSTPYFAMELVRGRPLNEYIEVNQPSLRSRLELLKKIASAVHYAHGRGVIHRDLKPANIIVLESGDPKILDFGVARTTESDLKATHLQTEVGQLIGTVPYMSPEQVSGDSDEIDARSDVYSLGVMLYEVLAGHLPYNVDARAILEAARVICEQEPTSLSQVSRVYRGDVETIVAKALAKQRARRYQSAHELADDIARYLNDEPIVARPPSVIYQLQKFSHRHKAAAYGATAAIAAFLISSVVIAALWRQAVASERLATDRAEQLVISQAELQHEVDQKKLAIDHAKTAIAAIQEIDQGVMRMRGATSVRRKLVEQSVESLDRLQSQLGSQPWADEMIAEAHLRIGRLGLVDGDLLDEARHSLIQASAIFEQIMKSSPADERLLAKYIECEASIGAVLVKQGSTTLGAQHLETAKRLLDSSPQGVVPTQASPLYRVRATLDHFQGSVYAALGNTEQAKEHLERAAEAWQELSTSKPIVESREGWARSLLTLAELGRNSGEPVDASLYYSNALDLQRETCKLYPQDLPNSLLLADILLKYGDYKETTDGGSDHAGSLADCRERLEIIDEGIILDPAYHKYRVMRLDTLHSIAQLLAKKGDYAAARVGAEQFLNAAMAYRQRDPTDSFAVRKVAIGQWTLAIIDIDEAGLDPKNVTEHLRKAKGRLKDAEATFEWLIGQSPEMVDYWKDLIEIRSKLAETVKKLWKEQPTEAEGLVLIQIYQGVTTAGEALADLRALSDTEAEAIAMTMRNAGTICLILNKYEEAVDSFGRANELHLRDDRSVNLRMAVAYFGFGDNEIALQYWFKAESLNRELSELSPEERLSMLEDIEQARLRYQLPPR